MNEENDKRKKVKIFGHFLREERYEQATNSYC